MQLTIDHNQRQLAASKNLCLFNDELYTAQSHVDGRRRFVNLHTGHVVTTPLALEPITLGKVGFKFEPEQAEDFRLIQVEEDCRSWHPDWLRSVGKFVIHTHEDNIIPNKIDHVVYIVGDDGLIYLVTTIGLTITDPDFKIEDVFPFEATCIPNDAMFIAVHLI